MYYHFTFIILSLYVPLCCLKLWSQGNSYLVPKNKSHVIHLFKFSHNQFLPTDLSNEPFFSNFISSVLLFNQQFILAIPYNSLHEFSFIIQNTRPLLFPQIALSCYRHPYIYGTTYIFITLIIYSNLLNYISLYNGHLKVMGRYLYPLFIAFNTFEKHGVLGLS